MKQHPNEIEFTVENISAITGKSQNEVQAILDRYKRATDFVEDSLTATMISLKHTLMRAKNEMSEAVILLDGMEVIKPDSQICEVAPNLKDIKTTSETIMALEDKISNVQATVSKFLIKNPNFVCYHDNTIGFIQLQAMFHYDYDVDFAAIVKESYSVNEIVDALAERRLASEAVGSSKFARNIGV